MTSGRSPWVRLVTGGHEAWWWMPRLALLGHYQNPTQHDVDGGTCRLARGGNRCGRFAAVLAASPHGGVGGSVRPSALPVRLLRGLRTIAGAPPRADSPAEAASFPGSRCCQRSPTDLVTQPAGPHPDDRQAHQPARQHGSADPSSTSDRDQQQPNERCAHKTDQRTHEERETIDREHVRNHYHQRQVHNEGDQGDAKPASPSPWLTAVALAGLT